MRPMFFTVNRSQNGATEDINIASIARVRIEPRAVAINCMQITQREVTLTMHDRTTINLRDKDAEDFIEIYEQLRAKKEHPALHA